MGDTEDNSYIIIVNTSRLVLLFHAWLYGKEDDWCLRIFWRNFDNVGICLNYLTLF